MHKTAFLVMIAPNGDVAIDTDPKNLSVEVSHEATLRDIRRATTEIVSDLQAQATAQYVASTLMYEPPQPAAEEVETTNDAS